MNDKRIEIGQKLRNILGSEYLICDTDHSVDDEFFDVPRVFYQPPENIKLVYPCVIYNLDGVNARSANDRVYMSHNRYIITFITEDPDNNYYQKMLENFRMVRFDRRFIQDGLYHDVYTIY